MLYDHINILYDHIANLEDHIILFYDHIILSCQEIIRSHNVITWKVFAFLYVRSKMSFARRGMPQNYWVQPCPVPGRCRASNKAPWLQTIPHIART